MSEVPTSELYAKYSFDMPDTFVFTPSDVNKLPPHLNLQKSCSDDPRCSIYKAIRDHYHRWDCPLMCDDGCIYNNDCRTGTPLPSDFAHVHDED